MGVPAGGSRPFANLKPPRIYQEHRGAVKDPLSYVGKDVLLNDNNSPQCAELVKKLAGAPKTGEKNWQRGEPLTASNVASLEVGTPIASGWNADGFYPHHSTGQHAGIFAGVVTGAKKDVIAFWIVEQYSGSGLTSGRETIVSRIVYFDPVAHGKKKTYFYTGGDYATIKW